jgi:FkbM family methyltransferase
MTCVDYANWDSSPQGVLVAPDLPEIDNEEYPEWIDLLSAATDAGDRFAMVELGAGYGRWLVNGAFAYRELKPDGAIALVGVEAEPTHFAWLSEHMRRNGIEPTEHELIEAAVADSPGRVMFEVGESSNYWGQSIRRSWLSRLRSSLKTKPVEAITLAAAFKGVDGMIDLVDLDVQDAEADILESGADELDRVRRVHIGTHSAKSERRLRALFSRLGWKNLTDYRSDTTVAETWWGGRDVYFQDGVQSWLNTTLS